MGVLKHLFGRQAAMGIARHVLTTWGGVLVAQGYLDEQSASELMGAAMALFGVLWSLFEKLPAK